MLLAHTFSRPAALTAVLALLAACARPAARGAPAPGAPYDVVIAGGRIVDGTGNPWFYGDVALRGDRIVRVGPTVALTRDSARRFVNARGLVVAPGFIDIQSHSWDELLWADGRVVSKVTQGVTTEILGEATTPAPVNANVLALHRFGPEDSIPARLYPTFAGPRGFGHWLDAMARHPRSVNAGSYLGATTVRAYAMGQRAGAPDAAALDTMRRVVRDAMRDGAFGISSALIYPPGSYATTGELAEMARAMAPYHGAYITHMRSEEEQLLEAMDEALAIGRAGGVPVIVYHLKAAGACNWGKARAMVAKIDSARAAGQDVTASMYPYPASSNNLGGGIIPQWAEEDGRLLDNLREPATRERIVREVGGPGAGGCEVANPGAIMVVGLRRPELRKYEGMRLDAVAAEMRKSWPEAMADLIVAEEGRVDKFTFSMSEENIAMQLRRPWVVIGSDAGGQDPDSARFLSHPRGYGAFTRLLGKYVREDSVLTLEDAVRRMTSATAGLLGLRDRGLLREGMYADVVLFDPATVADRATYTQPHQLSTGVRHVFVNGVEVVRDGRHTGATPGRVVRGPGWRGDVDSP